MNKIRHIYIPSLVLAAVVIIVVISKFSVAGASDPELFPPATPLALAANVVENSVELAWMPSQAGTYPVAGYIISKSSNGQDFTDIGNSSQASFHDPAGQVNDSYTVRAHDDQTPPHESPATDRVKAKIPTTDLSPTVQLIAASSITVPEQEQAVQSKSQTDNLQSYVSTVTDNKLAALRPKHNQENFSNSNFLLEQYIDAKTLLINKLPTLSSKDKQKAVDNCLRQESDLETTLLLLPSSRQAKAYEGLAQCQLITGSHD